MTTGKTVAEAAIDVLEHRRLEREVIEAAKEWRLTRLSQIEDRMAASGRLGQAVTALEAFEAEQKK